MNLEKRTTGLSSEGPKMVGERFGLSWNGRKMAKSGDPRWQLPPWSPARSGRVRRWLPVKFHGYGCLVVALLPGRRMCSGGGRNRLPRLKPEWPEKGSKRLSSRSTGFGGIFLGFLGLGTPLERKTRII